MDPAQKRSSLVVLTLSAVPVGAIALANAFPGQQMQRNLYPDRATCERDYSPSQCQQGSGGGSSYAGSWHGPYYYSNRASASAQSDPGPGRIGWRMPTEISTRGGFGSFGRAMRAGG